MTNAFDSKQITDQLESMFFAPARAYAELSVDYTETLARITSTPAWRSCATS
ncbi:hypothetical protein [Halomonas korlensis]|uniref:Uncharacterized protein n=1 Tax=Halomonas korlensis TaxID=463301 RepID=A0A1I7HIM0_9GAMM|nr:hypothetical protein [Halomonas korlensis]SFU60590.1 hypothetical protein SAMN04487955_104293 [Halomonas korlensis]